MPLQHNTNAYDVTVTRKVCFGVCIDMLVLAWIETGKGGPTLQGKSPGNIEATDPFQVIAMDSVPSLPKSYKGNMKLLI